MGKQTSGVPDRLPIGSQDLVGGCAYLYLRFADPPLAFMYLIVYTRPING